MILSGLTFTPGDVSDPASAQTAIGGYAEEWHKLDLFKVHGIDYNPSWDTVKELKALGCLVTLAGHDKKGELKVFFVGTKSPYLYNPKLVYCSGFMLYYAKEYRKKPWVFKKFMKELDKQMKVDGVDLYSVALPADERLQRAHASMVKNGFHTQDIVFMKRTK